MRKTALTLLFGIFCACPALAQSPPPPAGDWQLEWAEEFNQPGDSSALAARWRFCYPWGRNLGGLETEYYTGDAVRRDSGNLYLIAKRLPQPLPYRGRELKYSSGMLFSRHPGPDSLQPVTCQGAEGFSYGLFEMRCRQPRDPNSFPAFWLFGSPDEVDIFEGDYAGFSNTVHVIPHPYWRPEQQQAEHCSCYFYDADRRQNLHQRYHTYALAWRPDELTFYFDGYPIRRETRYTPLGCPLSLIADLAMWNWATPAADTLAIDYIRVYRPRHPYPAAFLARPGGPNPQPDTRWLPAATAPGRPDPTPRQWWALQPDAAGHLRLELTRNDNPGCNSFLALPVAGAGWSPPLTLQAGLPALHVHFGSPDPVQWEMRDGMGRAVLSGATAGEAEWNPAWASLPPGAYRLWLRQGEAEVMHPVVVLGHPVSSVPRPEWLLPAGVTTGQ